VDGSVRLLWIMPIYQSECDAIARDGMDAFDAGMQDSDYSPADPSRPPYVT